MGPLSQGSHLDMSVSSIMGGDNHRSARSKIDITWILALIVVVTYAKFSCVVLCWDVMCHISQDIEPGEDGAGWRVGVAHRGGNQRWGKLGNQSRGCHIALPGHLSWQSRDYHDHDYPRPGLRRPWELGLLVNTLTSLTALYNLNFPDALHDKKIHIWSRPGKWKRLNTVLQRIMKVLPWSATPHCIFMA